MLSEGDDAMIDRLLFDLKSVRKCLILMVLLSWICLPILNNYQMEIFPKLDVFYSVLSQAQLFLPITVSLPVAIYLRQLFEGGSFETLHALPTVYKHGPTGVLLLELVCQIQILPIFLWYGSCYGSFLWPELLRTVCQGFFLQNLAYAIMYLSRIPISGVASQLLVAGVMQMAVTGVGREESLLTYITIYAHHLPFAQRPWNPFQLAVTATLALVFFAIGARRTRNALK